MQLAKHHDGETSMRTEELATKEAVSANFLVQILSDLRKAGLVLSRRGKMGGYLLQKSPEEINLREIVDAIEPSMLQLQNRPEGESGEAVCTFWQEFTKEFVEKLENTPLSKLSNQQNELMFYI